MSDNQISKKPVIGDAEALAFRVRGALGEFNDHNKSVVELVREVSEQAAHARYAGGGEADAVTVKDANTGEVSVKLLNDDIGSGVELYSTTPAQPKVPDGWELVPIEFMAILHAAPEISPSNYDHYQVCALNEALNQAFSLLASQEGE